MSKNLLYIVCTHSYGILIRNHIGSYAESWKNATKQWAGLSDILFFGEVCFKELLCDGGEDQITTNC